MSTLDTTIWDDALDREKRVFVDFDFESASNGAGGYRAPRVCINQVLDADGNDAAMTDAQRECICAAIFGLAESRKPQRERPEE